VKIIIWTPPFRSSSGGITVLHKLCHLLRLRGVDAYVWINKKSPAAGDCNRRWQTPIANGAVDPQDCVVVYPEIVIGDPLHGRRIVRWLLNRPGVIGGNGIFGSKDIVLHYQPSFAESPDPSFRLTIYEPWLEINNPGDTPRAGGCYTVRKGRRKAPIPETAALEELPRLSSEAYASIFKTKEIFYSYDTVTFLSIQAALCGCVSVVVPDSDLTAAEWRRGRPLMTYGVAYGPEEIGWARDTMGLLPKVIEAAALETEIQISAFLCRLQ